MDYIEQLCNEAKSMLNNAYAPYSGFKVGSALLTESNKIFKGCNIESVSFTPTICAERVAIFNAVSNRNIKFKAIAVATMDSKLSSPCGVCLQVMSEFVDDDFTIILVNLDNKIEVLKFKNFLPRPFRPNSNIGNY